MWILGVSKSYLEKYFSLSSLLILSQGTKNMFVLQRVKDEVGNLSTWSPCIWNSLSFWKDVALSEWIFTDYKKGNCENAHLWNWKHWLLSRSCCILVTCEITGFAFHICENWGKLTDFNGTCMVSGHSMPHLPRALSFCVSLIWQTTRRYCLLPSGTLISDPEVTGTSNQ